MLPMGAWEKLDTFSADSYGRTSAATMRPTL